MIEFLMVLMKASVISLCIMICWVAIKIKYQMWKQSKGE
jgi:hypothetical protein